MKIYDLDKNPVVKINRFAHDQKPQYKPLEIDILKVLAVTSGADRVFLLCYLKTAARRSEIFNLKWDDVNFEKKEIRLWTKKTRDGFLEGEWLPMNETLSRELLWWWNKRKSKESTFVFIDDQPGPHCGKCYKERRRFLSGICKRAGVKPLGFHALMRFVASILADRHKVSSKTVQRFLRHKSVHTTELYIQNINKDLHSVAGVKGSFFRFFIFNDINIIKISNCYCVRI